MFNSVAAYAWYEPVNSGRSRERQRQLCAGHGDLGCGRWQGNAYTYFMLFAWQHLALFYRKNIFSFGVFSVCQVFSVNAIEKVPETG